MSEGKVKGEGQGDKKESQMKKNHSPYRNAPIEIPLRKARSVLAEFLCNSKDQTKKTAMATIGALKMCLDEAAASWPDQMLDCYIGCNVFGVVPEGGAE